MLIPKVLKLGVDECFIQNRVVKILSTNTYAFNIDMTRYGKVIADIHNQNLKELWILFSKLTLFV